VPTSRPLVEVGVDSLRAVQARNAVGKYFSRTYPSKLLFDCPTVEALARFLVRDEPVLRGLFEEPAAAPAAPPADTPEALLARLARMSDEEAESLAASLAARSER